MNLSQKLLIRAKINEHCIFLKLLVQAIMNDLYRFLKLLVEAITNDQSGFIKLHIQTITNNHSGSPKSLVQAIMNGQVRSMQLFVQAITNNHSGSLKSFVQTIMNNPSESMKKGLNSLSSIVIVAAMSASLLLSGCGSDSSGNDDAGTGTPNSSVQEATPPHLTDGKTVVGISMPDRLLERWNRDGSYLKDEFEKKDCEVILRYANNLIDTQIDNIREMLEGGADILVITAVDGAALTKVLEVASAQQVSVVAYDRLLMNTDAVDYYVSFDNYQVGVLQAEYIISQLNLYKTQDTKYMEFVTGDPVDNNARYFYRGAIDTLSPFLDTGRLTIRSGQTDFYETATAQWSTDIAQQRLQIILNSYYPEYTRLDAVLCANDSTALGATKALASDYRCSNKVLITGQDADIPNVYNIIDGLQSMTVYKHLPQESVVTVDLCMDILSGEKPDEGLIGKSHWGFDCSYNTTDYNNGNKAVQSYLLRPIAITSDNIEKELFETGYYNRNSAGLIYVSK